MNYSIFYFYVYKIIMSEIKLKNNLGKVKIFGGKNQNHFMYLIFICNERAKVG